MLFTAFIKYKGHLRTKYKSIDPLFKFGLVRPEAFINIAFPIYLLSFTFFTMVFKDAQPKSSKHRAKDHHNGQYQGKRPTEISCHHRHERDLYGPAAKEVRKMEIRHALFTEALQ